MLKALSLFSGIGGFDLAAEMAGIEVVGVREDVANAYSQRYIHWQPELNAAEAGKYAQRDTATGDTPMANTRCELRQGSGECREVEREARAGVASDSEFSSGTLCPTPQAVDGSAGGIISPDDTYVQKASGLFRKINRNGTDGSVGLARMVKLCPTPNACDQYSGHAHDEGRHYLRWEVKKLWLTPRQFMYKDSTTDRNKGNIGEKVGGQLNPDWVEQLMNFPGGWTDLEVDEPGEWVGWPALMGGRLWGTHTATFSVRSSKFISDAVAPAEFVANSMFADQYPYEYPRTTTGCKNRAKRLKALGNAVVPAQAYPFFRAIVEIERSVTNDC